MPWQRPIEPVLPILCIAGSADGVRVNVLVRSDLRCLVVSLILICASLGEGCTTFSLTQNADRIVIVKSAHTMTLMNNGQVLKTYRVALGKGDAAPKEQRGDQRTPEGVYVIDEKKDVTCCFLALHISYPNSTDVERARMPGVDPGDAIEIHGLPRRRAWLGRFHRMVDWTAGASR